MKPFTSNCQAKYDSVEKRRSYRLFNIANLWASSHRHKSDSGYPYTSSS